MLTLGLGLNRREIRIVTRSHLVGICGEQVAHHVYLTSYHCHRTLYRYIRTQARSILVTCDPLKSTQRESAKLGSVIRRLTSVPASCAHTAGSSATDEFRVVEQVTVVGQSAEFGGVMTQLGLALVLIVGSASIAKARCEAVKRWFKPPWFDE